MACKFFTVREQKQPLPGGESAVHTEYLCGLKLQSEKMKSDVFEVLTAEGYESPFITDNCPFAEKKNFEWCPFCESP